MSLSEIAIVWINDDYRNRKLKPFFFSRPWLYESVLLSLFGLHVKTNATFYQ